MTPYNGGHYDWNLNKETDRQKEKRQEKTRRDKKRQEKTRTTNVVRNAGCARSRYTLKFFFNQLIN